MADLVQVSVDALLARIVHEEVRAALRTELAPLITRLDALAAATPPALVGLEEASRRLGKSTSSLRRLAGEGLLPGAIRIGRSWRIDLTAVRPATPETISVLAAEARSR
jgi:hypothetical protein